MTTDTTRRPDGDEAGPQDGDQGEAAPPPTLVEWTVRAISVVTMAALFGFLLWQAFTAASPSVFDVAPRLDQVERREGSYVLPVDITNAGSTSVTNLTVTIGLRDGPGAAGEQETIVIPILGHGETVTVHAWFGPDPRRRTVAVDIGSYLTP